MSSCPTLSTAAVTASQSCATLDDPQSAPNLAVSHPDEASSIRVFRKGDLVRVAERRGARVKRRDGGLGRIHRVVCMSDDDAEDGPRYDVDWVLGGRLLNVHRSELVYTTADAEGLTEDAGAMRARRTRKPKALEAPQMEPPPKKRKATAKKSASKKKGSAAGKKEGKPTAAGTKGGGAAGKKKGKATADKNGQKRKGAGSKTDKKAATKRMKLEEAESEEEKDLLNLYDRHVREFERCLVRLEKADVFGFFLGPPPDEYDENDRDEPDSGFSSSAAAVLGVESQSACVPSPNAENPSTVAETTAFPSRPPFNFEVIRKRMKRGRYVLDRIEEAEKERKQIRTSEGLDEMSHDGKCSMAQQPLELVNPKGVSWELFRKDITEMCDAAIERDPCGTTGGSGTLGHSANKIKDVLSQMYERVAKRQINDLEQMESRRKFSRALKAAPNTEAAMQGRWRQKRFPERKYEQLTTNVICAGLPDVDKESAMYELRTSLPDSFVGLSYVYNDTGQSEGWMKSVLDGAKNSKDATPEAQNQSTGDDERNVAKAIATDDGVVRAQVQASMRVLLIAVQDRVMTESDVLHHPELRSANWETATTTDIVSSDIKVPAIENGAASEYEALSFSEHSESPDLVEKPVWGIDCYTRRNISTCLEVDFEPEIAMAFVERWLLPAINACPDEQASNLENAARILEGLPLLKDSTNGIEENLAVPCSSECHDSQLWSHSLLGAALRDKMRTDGPPWLRIAARRLREAVGALGNDFFRVHPKGHGSIVLKPKIKAHTLVTFYRGEIYASWRWGEKMDAIEQTQKRLGLRPNLPDFYNMALERPQIDPRGYGLLFIDASRKAGHGSTLSHSCDPTCEVRVAAMNGRLCLAMTTLRDLEMGEELTFDYNAVTESLNEYQSAVCLCGHTKCRGSFLHFATADCYQQVLNRNCPIAARFASLAKGCTKQVMSEEDTELLRRHGFGTAAFGAVSVNHHNLYQAGLRPEINDCMEDVPIWLRTYVADTLRYIEYERRALPVALLCDHVRKSQSRNEESGSSCRPVKKAQRKKSSNRSERSAVAKGPGPEFVFDYFLRKQKPFFLAQLWQQGPTLSDSALDDALRTVASSAWAALGSGLKLHWQNEAHSVWEGRLKPAAKKSKPSNPVSTKSKKKRGRQVGSPDNKAAVEDDGLTSTGISFEAADAEGNSAMEQRIQQLTQALSRIGRVLHRHRECRQSVLSPQIVSSTAHGACREIHAPLVVLADKDVMECIWNHEDGVVRSLLREIDKEACVSPELKKAIRCTVAKYTCFSLKSANARQSMNSALLELRDVLLRGIEAMEIEMKSYELERDRRRGRARRQAQKKQKEEAAKSAVQTREESETGCAHTNNCIRSVVASVLQDMTDTVMRRLEISGEDGVASFGVLDGTESSISVDDELKLSPWMEHYHNKWKLAAAADLLLFYANTSTFFSLQPYKPFASAPIAVYARELGNAVPRSVIEVAKDNQHEIIPLTNDKDQADSEAGQPDNRSQMQDSDAAPNCRRPKYCEPDEVITNVTVTYQGDYVLAQLLQWYNGGIGQKPGLPDLLGCVLLPHMSGCWKDIICKNGSIKKMKPSYYQSEIHPRLLDWFKDPRKRGSTFPDSIRRVFCQDAGESSESIVLMGSPVLDLLVSGDDRGIHNIIASLSEKGKGNEGTTKGASDPGEDRLQSTVDEGMPAQAVANWVQCENPSCLKWRRLPWHVDVDALPDTFTCSDNRWNAAASSCEAPEDTWDERDALISDGGVPKDSDREMMISEIPNPIDTSNNSDSVSRKESNVDESEFVIGARLNVLRTGKEKYCTGVVVDKDLNGRTKRVKFHFPRVSSKFDEWIEMNSARIAPLSTAKVAPLKEPTRTKVSTEKAKKTAKNSGHKKRSSYKDVAEQKNKEATRLDTSEKMQPASSDPSCRPVASISTSARDDCAAVHRRLQGAEVPREPSVNSTTVEAVADLISEKSPEIANSMILNGNVADGGSIDATTLADMVRQKSLLIADSLVRSRIAPRSMIPDASSNQSSTTSTLEASEAHGCGQVYRALGKTERLFNANHDLEGSSNRDEGELSSFTSQTMPKHSDPVSLDYSECIPKTKEAAKDPSVPMAGMHGQSHSTVFFRDNRNVSEGLISRIPRKAVGNEISNRGLIHTSILQNHVGSKLSFAGIAPPSQVWYGQPVSDPIAVQATSYPGQAFRGHVSPVSHPLHQSLTGAKDAKLNRLS